MSRARCCSSQKTYDVLWAETIVMSKGTLELGQGVPRGTAEHAAQQQEQTEEDA